MISGRRLVESIDGLQRQPQVCCDPQGLGVILKRMTLDQHLRIIRKPSEWLSRVDRLSAIDIQLGDNELGFEVLLL